jgi:hypothetical protein
VGAHKTYWQGVPEGLNHKGTCNTQLGTSQKGVSG